MRTSIRKRIMPLLLALALIIGLFPMLSTPAQATGATEGQLRTTTLNFTTDGYKSETGVTETSSGIWENTAEGWSYNATTNTLTLLGVNIRSADAALGTVRGISLPEDATIVLTAGTTNIVRAGDAGSSSGISGNGALTIQGSGTLIATGGSAEAVSEGIYSSSTVSISGGTVTATGGTAGTTSSGISGASVTVTSGTVTATGGTAGTTSSGIHAVSTLALNGGLIIAQSTSTTGTVQAMNTAASGTLSTALTGSYTAKFAVYGAAAAYPAGNISATAIDCTSYIGDETIIPGVAIWTQATKTLTITNLILNTTAETAITLPDGAKIALVGTSVIRSGDVTGADSDSTAVWGKGALAIDDVPDDGNDGALFAIGGTAEDESCGIWGDLAVTITGGTVTATGGSATNYSYGICSWEDNNTGTVTISGGAVTAVGGTTAYGSYGIWGTTATNISGGNVTAIGNSTIDESCGIMASLEVNISGGSVTAMSGSATEYSYGICSWEDNNTGTVTISGGAVTAVGGTTAYGSYGIWGTTATNISGGNVTATGGTVTGSYSGGGSYGIYSEAAVGIEGGNVTATGGTTKLASDADDETQIDSYGIYSAGAMEIQSGSTVTATGGTTADDSSYGIFGTSSITITDSTVTATGGTTADDSSYGIFGTLSITITDSIVTATGGTTADDSSVGIAGTSITINSGTVTATGGTAGNDNSYGIGAAESITINGGTVTATGGTADDDNSYGIYAYNSDGTATVSITGGTVTATGGTASGTYTIGIYGKTSVAISGGMVTVSGGTSSGTFSVGIFCEDSFAASGANTVITAQSGTGAQVCAALATGGGDSDNIAFNDGLGVFAPAGGVTGDFGNGLYTTIFSDTTDDMPETYVVIKALSVTGVAVKTAPTKVTYTAGDALDLSGLVVTLTKSGGSTQDVVFTDFAANGLTTTPANGTALATTETTVTITHTVSGKTASQTITVNAAAGGGQTGGETYTPSRTITVTETTSELFKDSEGKIKAEANMSNAFSSSVEVKITDTETDASDFGLGAGNKVYPFDISLYIKGTDTKTEPKDGYAVRISLPIPKELLDVKDQLSIMHKSDNGTVTKLNSQLTQINGVWYLVFEASEFSPYALVVSDVNTYDDTAGLPYYMDAGGNEVFIGFAANGKYIAPSGMTVLVKQNAKSFTDTADHWAADYIDFVTERELFTGTGNGMFSPDTGMTRAMFAIVIGRLYERSFGEIEATDTHSFTDCDYDDYYGKYVDWAAEEGIISGYGNGQFSPNDQISREQMAMVLYRFANFLGVLPADTDTELGYPDAGDISSWAQNAALYCQSTGIIAGRDGGNFAPQGTATRAEVAVILERFIENVLN